MFGYQWFGITCSLSAFQRFSFSFRRLNTPVLPGRSDAVAVTVTLGLADASTVVVYFHDPLATSNTAAPLSTTVCVLSSMVRRLVWRLN